MTKKRFEMGDYTNCRYDICEILKDGDYYCTVATEDADLIINVLDENEQLKSDLDYFQRTYEIEERGLDIVAPMCTIGSPTPSRLELFKENEQLKQQLNIFEKFLEGNDLDIEWDEFCGVDECAFENPDFSCKECIHLKGDVE